MSFFGTVALLAATSDSSDGAGTFLGFLILFGFLYAIYKSLTKKKSYRFGGQIHEQ